ncbi:DUF4145 domain-containing protein [Cytobacillus gottheilii]|uniref:DUF4145 domain-containing protein n=1 Tax=Cytobacillus gottheilii TaxID=859144 RepID=UPI002495186D|nr:DUF4145 domain-containing protein [Cytobacillus gottheilii]
MSNNNYFYKFLEPLSKDLALLARELEYSVFTSPRMMLTHARAFIEDIINRVIKEEGISDIGCSGLNERIYLLQTYDILPVDVRDSVHKVRKLGNEAAHNTKVYRYSEALVSWESLYVLVNWFMKSYGPKNFEIVSYQEPAIESANKYDSQELELRFNQWQDSLLQKLSQIAGQVENNVAVLEKEPDVPIVVPGETKLRSITYKGESLDIPYFLRDAFLLPQRFENAERFMIALGGVQQARIMSELPSDLEGISQHVKRYKEDKEAQLFYDLQNFISEERTRRKVMHERKGELFLFFRSEYIILTENIAQIPLTEKYFTGFPNFLRQLQEDGMMKVGQLPQELLILAKYDRVGVGTVRKLFLQMKEIQGSI